MPHKLSTHYKILLLKRIKPLLERKSLDDLTTSLLSRLVDEQVALTKKGKLSPKWHDNITSFLLVEISIIRHLISCLEMPSVHLAIKKRLR